MTFKKAIGIICFILTAFSLNSCKYYNLTGGDPGKAKTFQVNFFQNYASESPGSTIQPGLDRDFTIGLQDLIANQTRLSMVNNNNSDLLYEGEIVEYRIAPMTATAQQTAAQNRLTMSVNVRFFNNVEEDKDFERRFTHFFDYPATSQLNSVKDAAHQEIFDRIMQDIFTASLANW